jgi:hypothetical protein
VIKLLVLHEDFNHRWERIIVKIVPHPDTSKPRLKVVRIEEEDKIAPSQLIVHAFLHGAVDGLQSLYQLIWVQYGERNTPVSYYVKYLRRCEAHGAMMNMREGVYLPKEEEVRQ